LNGEKNYIQKCNLYIDLKYVCNQVFSKNLLTNFFLDLLLYLS